MTRDYGFDLGVYCKDCYLKRNSYWVKPSDLILSTSQWWEEDEKICRGCREKKPVVVDFRTVNTYQQLK